MSIVVCTHCKRQHDIWSECDETSWAWDLPMPPNGRIYLLGAAQEFGYRHQKLNNLNPSLFPVATPLTRSLICSAPMGAWCLQIAHLGSSQNAVEMRSLLIDKQFKVVRTW